MKIDRDEVLHLAKNGETYYAIAKRFGCTPAHVGNIARAAGVRRVNPEGRNQRLVPRVWTMWQEGKTLVQIASAVGVTKGVVAGLVYREQQRA